MIGGLFHTSTAWLRYNASRSCWSPDQDHVCCESTARDASMMEARVRCCPIATATSTDEAFRGAQCASISLSATFNDRDEATERFAHNPLPH